MNENSEEKLMKAKILAYMAFKGFWGTEGGKGIFVKQDALFDMMEEDGIMDMKKEEFQKWLVDNSVTEKLKKFNKEMKEEITNET